MIIKYWDHFRPKSVLHIGAHTGQEAEAYYRFGVKQVAFVEANHNYMERLRTHCSQFPFEDCSFHNYAVCDEDDRTIDFYVTSNEESSSLLKMDQHKVIYPHIVETETISVSTITIDTLSSRRIGVPIYEMINLDIQGAELLALRGGKEYLKKTKCVYTEFNTAELYEGCALLPELDEFLSKFGFVRKVTQYAHNTWGDALYLKDA